MLAFFYTTNTFFFQIEMQVFYCDLKKKNQKFYCLLE